jgi:hypothetical protein
MPLVGSGTERRHRPLDTTGVFVSGFQVISETRLARRVVLDGELDRPTLATFKTKKGARLHALTI